MGTFLKIRWHEGFPGLFVHLLARYEALKRVLKVVGGGVGALAKEVSWNSEGIAVDFNCRGVFVLVLGGCAEAEHDPRKFLFPLF